jgi:hypothetical protein
METKTGNTTLLHATEECYAMIMLFDELTPLFSKLTVFPTVTVPAQNDHEV